MLGSMWCLIGTYDLIKLQKILNSICKKSIKHTETDTSLSYCPVDWCSDSFRTVRTFESDKKNL